jgi:putative ABC transport system permease protein
MPPWLMQDIRFAVRQFRRNPAFTVAVILTLALGIGATTAIFSLVDGILLRPLPFPGADRLVAISTLEFPPGISPTNTAAAGYVASSYPNLFDWRRQNHTFESLASYDYVFRLFSKANGENAQVIAGGRVSANLFPTLGVAPALGRNFTAEEEQPGHRVVILSHELWVSDFGSSPDVVGQTVKISDEPSIVVGVMPAGFHYAIEQPALFWATFAADAEGRFPGTAIRDWDRLAIVGRMRPGVQLSQALADLNTIQRGLAQQYPEIGSRSAVSIAPLLDDAVGQARPVLMLLLGSVALVLLIACANVAGLLLARATSRRAELAVRTALGANRVRVARQLLIEALLLAIGGGDFGILAAIAVLRIGVRYVPSDVPRMYNVALNGHILAFAVFLSAATALIFGFLPAWRMSKSDPANTLRESGAGMTSGRGRNHLHHALVIAETALSFTLLVGSGLLIKSMLNILHLDPGFDTNRTVFFDIALTNTRYSGATKVAFYKKLMPELAAVAGVEKVGSGHPLAGLGTRGVWTNFQITGHVYSPDTLPAAQASAIVPGYFETLSIPLLRGRIFTEHDNDPGSTPVAVINRSLARQYFPNEDPIGKYLTPLFEHTTEPIVARQIVGIVGDTRSGDPWEPYQLTFFLPYAQHASHQRPIVVMKVSGDPLSYENTVRAVVARFDRDALVFGYRPLASVLDEQAAQPRFETFLVSGFAGIALLLSALGLYAVLSYIVAERSRELGLRMALGASRFHILEIVVRRALILAGLGLGAGALASIFTTRLVTGTLLQVAPLDRSVFLVVTVLLSLVSIVAALIPALRAANIDPMRTLREQ